MRPVTSTPTHSLLPDRPGRRPVRRALAAAAVLMGALAPAALSASPAAARIDPNVVPPGVPTILSVTPGNGSLTVEWEPSVVGDPATDVTVEILPDHLGCVWTTGPNTCTVTGLVNGREYLVDVIASNAGGGSLPAAWPTLVKPFTVPGSPQAVTAVPGDASALVAWAAPASDGGRPVSSYSVSSLPAGGSCVVETGPLMCNIEGLTNGVPYVFVVTATNEAGAGPSSAPVAAVTPRTIPSAVTSITGTAGNQKIDVSWTPPASDGGMPVTGYTVTAVPGGQSCTWTAGPLTCTVEGLTNGTLYAVTVEATNVAGTGPRVRSADTFRPVTVPAAPSVLTTTARNGAVDVTFSATPDMGGSSIVRYTVTSSTGQSCTVTAGPRRCRVAGLTNGTEVTFTVTATNGVGEGPASAPSAPVAPFTTPSSPLAVVATSRGGKVEVRWGAARNDGGKAIDCYLVEVTTDGRTWKQVADVLPAAGSTSVSGLTVGRAYGVRVVAQNAAGRSVASAATVVRVVK